MAYTVFIYKGCGVQDEKSFPDIQQVFVYLGTLEYRTDVERCIVDNGTKIIIDLKRGSDGNFTIK